MNIILFLLIGLAAGWLAGQIMGKKRGVLINLGIGVVGAFIGGFLFNIVGLAATGLVGSLIMATLGAVVLLWVVSKIE